MIALVFRETAPFLLLGLFLAGWLKIIIPIQGVHRYLGKPNLRSALYAALFGLPLPICSCGVVPLSLGLREKGASREANLSFLISTPETSIDTLIITWGLLGPVIAIVRPLAALAASLFAAILSIAERTDRPADDKDVAPAAAVCPTDDEQGADNAGYTLEEGYHVVGPRGFLRSVAAAIGQLPAFSKKDATAEVTAPAPVSLGGRGRDANRYAFRKMLDDISFWLVIGIVAAGLIAALVPANWIIRFPGGEWGSMLFILLISVPLYVCAVESTPIAAILILKGLSPGAALVFLLAGPATNLATMILINKTFGRRFLRLYLLSIFVVSIGAGLLLNAFLRSINLEVVSRISPEQSFGVWTIVAIFSSIALLVLLGFSFYRLDWKAKKQSALGFSGRLLAALGLLLPEKPAVKEKVRPLARLNHRRLATAAIALALLVWLLSGVYTVPPGSAGYRLTLGKLVQADVPPGLHYCLPRPLGKVFKYRTGELRKTDLGFFTDLSMLAKWKTAQLSFDAVGWHSFFTTMTSNPDESIYLMGDENQLEAKFAVHYRIANPTAFFFDYAKNKDLVSLTVESVAREILAGLMIDLTLTDRRGEITPVLKERSQALLDRYGIGVQILDIYLVDLHPPVEAVSAFRDVASAMEDRQTRVHRAYEDRAAALPAARGNAAKAIAGAQADAFAAQADNVGKADSFRTRAQAYAQNNQGTRFRMYLETMEAVLPNIDKIIAPPQALRDGRTRLWNDPLNADAVKTGE